MKLTIVGFLLLCGLSLFITAKPTMGSGFRQQNNAQEQEVISLHKELFNAWWVDHNAKVAEHLVADD